jgi:hypothetical protein
MFQNPRKNASWVNYLFIMTVNFLLQATRILTKGEYDENELTMITNFVNAVDNEILNDYNNTCTVLSYDNDLQLFVEVVDSLIKICELKEDYEICELLKHKRDECTIIMETKTI